MKHYKQKDNLYSFYDINTVMCFLGFLVFGLSIRGLISYNFATPIIMNDYIKLLSPIWLLLSIFFMAVGVKQMILNPIVKRLTVKYLFGIYKKQFDIIKPLKTQVITNLNNSNNVGIDIFIQTNKGMTKFQSYSPKYRNRIDEFLSETEQIINE